MAPLKAHNFQSAMAKSSEFTAVAEVYNIIKRLGNADHIIGDETTKAANTAHNCRDSREPLSDMPANNRGASVRSVVE